MLTCRTPAVSLLGAGLLAAGAAGLTLAPTAGALTARASLAGGGLSVAMGRPTALRPDGRAVGLRVTVTDARGSGAGWSLYLSAQERGSGDRQGGARDGGTAAAIGRVADPLVACASGVTCSPARSTLAFPLAVSLSGSPTKVFNATPGTGMGEQSVGLDLFLDAAGSARTVSTTITVQSGP